MYTLWHFWHTFMQHELRKAGFLSTFDDPITKGLQGPCLERTNVVHLCVAVQWEECYANLWF